MAYDSIWKLRTEKIQQAIIYYLLLYNISDVWRLIHYFQLGFGSLFSEFIFLSSAHSSRTGAACSSCYFFKTYMCVVLQNIEAPCVTSMCYFQMYICMQHIYKAVNTTYQYSCSLFYYYTIYMLRLWWYMVRLFWLRDSVFVRCDDCFSLIIVVKDLHVWWFNFDVNSILLCGMWRQNSKSVLINNHQNLSEVRTIQFSYFSTNII